MAKDRKAQSRNMKKPAAGTIIKIIISVGLMGVIFYKLSPKMPEVIELFKSISPALVFAAFVCQGAAYLLWTLRQKILLDAQNIRLSYMEVLRLTFIGLFFNSFLLGVTGGDVVKGYFLLKRAPDKKAQSIAVLFFDRLMGVGTVAALALFGLIAFHSDERFRPVLFAGLATVGIIIAALAAVNNKTLVSKFTFLRRFLKNQTITDFIKHFHQAITLYANRKKALTSAVVCSFVLQIISIIVIYLFGLAIGIPEITLKHYMLLVPIAFFINALPISIGGWGVGEMAFISLFAIFGVPEEKSFSLALLMHIIYLAWGMVGAIPYLTQGAVETDTEKMQAALNEAETETV